MSNEIKLKVPSEVTREVVEFDPVTKKNVAKKQTVEFVSHGNYEADLTPGSTVTTTSRKFADWLVGEFGLEEISDPSDDAEPQASKKTKAAKTNDGGDK